MPMTPPQAQQFGPAHTIKHVVKLEPYYVEYYDGEGRPNTRIVLRDDSGKGVFIVQENIGGVLVATAANRWFAQGMTKALLAPEEKAAPEAESI